MEAFAARFCACNHDAYPCAEAAYILAFAIVMLNTDAHNPLTDDALKMNREDFILMVTAAEATTKLDRESVAAIYDRVVTNEIKMHAAEPTAPERRGDEDEDVSRRTLSRPSAQLCRAVETPIDAERGERRDGGTAQENQGVVSERRGYRNASRGRRRGGVGALFVRASEPGLARPMPAAAGKFMLIALSSAFETAPDAAHAAMPLERARRALAGDASSIADASRRYMRLPRHRSRHRASRGHRVAV